MANAKFGFMEANKNKWSRGDRIAVISLACTIFFGFAAVIVVPEVRQFLGLESKSEKTENGYTQNSCGSITDARTNLEWYVGPDKFIAWPEAVDWVKNLEACDHGWRMPTITELQTLYSPEFTAGSGIFYKGKYWPAHIHPVFGKIGNGSWVWSGENVGREQARAMNFNQGVAVKLPYDDSEFGVRVFAVR